MESGASRVAHLLGTRSVRGEGLQPRILQVVNKPQRRGAETFARDLSGALRRHGAVVRSIYLYRCETDDAMAVEDDDVCLAGNERHPFESNPGLHPGLLLRLRREIEEFRPSVVQVNGSNTVKYGAATKALRPNGSWALVYRNIGFPSDWNGSRYKRMVYRRLIMQLIDGVAGVSQKSLRDAVELYDINAPAVVIENAVNPERMVPSGTRWSLRRSIGTEEDRVVVLFLGALTIEKRPDRFLRVIAKAALENPRLEAWIVGDGPLRAESEALARALGIEPRCRFFGSRENVADYLVAADLLLLTSDTEGIPAVAIEAGYLGLPVVAPNVGAIGECIIDKQTGCLTPRMSEDLLARIVLDLGQNENRRATLGLNAREHVMKTFALDAVTEKFLTFYDHLSSR